MRIKTESCRRLCTSFWKGAGAGGMGVEVEGAGAGGGWDSGFMGKLLYVLWIVLQHFRRSSGSLQTIKAAKGVNQKGWGGGLIAWGHCWLTFGGSEGHWLGGPKLWVAGGRSRFRDFAAGGSFCECVTHLWHNLLPMPRQINQAASTHTRAQTHIENTHTHMHTLMQRPKHTHTHT